MCCISGFWSPKPINPTTARDLARLLLVFGMNRGVDSSGVYSAGKLFKRVMDGLDLSSAPGFERVMSRPTKLVLCHNRMPTCGSIGRAQAQPFRHGNIVTVHNGWYSNMTQLKRLWSVKKPSGVDSELVASVASEHGIEKLPEFLADSVGSSAIAVAQGDRLFLLRDSNPTAYAIIGNLFIFASTTEILRGAVELVFRRHKVAYSVTPEDQLLEVTTAGLKVLGHVPQRYGYPWAHGCEYDFSGWEGGNDYERMVGDGWTRGNGYWYRDKVEEKMP